MKLVKRVNQITEEDIKIMNEGSVKWYNESKGFGFIETENKKEIFVHRSGLSSPFSGLSEGQKVTFDIRQGDKGEVAFNVK